MVLTQILVGVPKEFWDGRMLSHYYINPTFAQGDLDYPTPYDIHDSDRLAANKRKQASFEYAAWLSKPSSCSSLSKDMVSKLMTELFASASMWYTDDLAMFRTVAKIMNHAWEKAPTAAFLENASLVHEAAESIFLCSIIASNVGRNVFSKLTTSIGPPTSWPGDAICGAWSNLIVEQLRNLGGLPTANRAHRDIMSGIWPGGLTAFSLDDSEFFRNTVGLSGYKFFGLLYIIDGSEGYILDNSAIDQIVLCIRNYANSCFYVSFYRVISDEAVDRSKVRDAFQKIIAWIVHQVLDCGVTTALPRHMKQSFSILKYGNGELPFENGDEVLELQPHFDRTMAQDRQCGLAL